MTFNRNGSSLISGSSDGTIKIYNNNGVLTNSWKSHDSVLSLRLNDDNSRLLSIGTDCTIKEWDLVNNMMISFL